VTGDPFRPDVTIEVTGPTSSRDLRRSRWRDGWRAWWRHRGEEISAVLSWLGDHPELSVPMGVILGIGLCAAPMLAVRHFATQSCVDDCQACGADTGTLREGCHCIGDGRVEPFGKWIPRDDPAALGLRLRLLQAEQAAADAARRLIHSAT